MTLEELVQETCPFERKIAQKIYRIGFLYALRWWFEHEKVRHLEDIERIEKDLSKLETHNVDVSKIRAYIDM